MLARGKLLVSRMFPLHVVVETLPANALLPTDLQIRRALEEKPQKTFNIYGICKNLFKILKIMNIFHPLINIGEKGNDI